MKNNHIETEFSKAEKDRYRKVREDLEKERKKLVGLELFGLEF
jgi:hypothetical protein